jgi:glycosyltransferase involved in cell wall biosynthesis
VISVVIPVRNGAHTLRTAVESVLAGPAGLIELIVVDDGSIDDPAGSIAAHVDAGRVRVLRTVGVGVSEARNIGAAECIGDAIAFLDADDLLLPGWSSSMSALLTEPDVGLASCAMAFRGRRGDEVRVPEPQGPSGHGFPALFLAGAFCVRRDVWSRVGGYDVDLRFGENTELGFRICGALRSAGLRAAMTDEVFAVSMRRTFEGHHPEAVSDGASRVLRVHADRARRDPLFRRRYLTVQGVADARLGQRRAARLALWKAWCMAPTDRRAAGRVLIALVPGLAPWVWGAWRPRQVMNSTTSLPQASVALSVVVPVYNGAAVLPELLQSLAADEPPPGGWELIACDDGSTDPSLEVLDSWRDRLPLRVLAAGGGLGVGGARNLGAEAASGRAIVFIDQDDATAPGFFRTMEHALRNADVAVPRYDCDSLNSRSARGWRRIAQEHELPSIDGHPWGYGSGLGVSRVAFFSVRGFDAAYRHGSEDIDLCFRLHDAGYSVNFVPGAVLRYRFRSDLRGSLRQAFAYGFAGAQLRSTYRRAGLSIPSGSETLGTWGRALRRVMLGPTSADRIGALRTLANRVGRLRGAIYWKVPFA